MNNKTIKMFVKNNLLISVSFALLLDIFLFEIDELSIVFDYSTYSLII